MHEILTTICGRLVILNTCLWTSKDRVPEPTAAAFVYGRTLANPEREMVAWADYKKAAKERGSLALELYVVESTPVKPEDIPAHLPAHLKYQAAQEQAGALAFAGPLSDLSGDNMEGTGLIVYRADSLEAAKAIADADPMHSSGTRSYTVRRWMINEGSLQLDIKLSAQSISM